MENRSTEECGFILWKENTQVKPKKIAERLFKKRTVF